MTLRPDDEHLTIDYVALALGISRRSVQRLIVAGRLAAVRVSRKTTRIPRSALAAFLIASTRDNHQEN